MPRPTGVKNYNTELLTEAKYSKKLLQWDQIEGLLRDLNPDDQNGCKALLKYLHLTSKFVSKQNSMTKWIAA